MSIYEPSNSRPLSVALIGGEAAGTQALKLLVSGGVTVAFVCASTSDAVSMVKIARSQKVPMLDPAAIGSGLATRSILEHDVDLLLNIHSLQMLPEELLLAPRIGSFNLHPGPLPSYAGLGGPSWAIYNGESRHAVTLHWMTAGLDAGDIAYDRWFEIGDKATGLTVSTQCARLGLELVSELIRQAASDPASIPRTPQGPGERRLYRRNQVPGDGKIDWLQSAKLINRLVRASSYRPFPSVWGDPQTLLGDRPVHVVATALTDEQGTGQRPGTVIALADGNLAVVTGDGVLGIDRVSTDGRVVAASEVLSSGDILS